MGFFKHLIRRIFGKMVEDSINESVSGVQSDIEKKTTDAVKEISQPTEHFDRAAAMPDDMTAKWVELLPQYPIWCLGGDSYEFETVDDICYFTACFDNHEEALNAVKLYRRLLLQNGFCPKNGNSNDENLCKTVGGLCYLADTEHCFDSDDKALTIAFAVIKS